MIVNVKSETNTFRTGRQTETVVRTTLSAPVEVDGVTFVGLSNNTRWYDGELTQDNFWGVDANGGHYDVGRSAYQTLLEVS